MHIKCHTIMHTASWLGSEKISIVICGLWFAASMFGLPTIISLHFYNIYEVNK